jgi:methionyl aminopeptidase
MHLKTPQEIELMREGGHILSDVLDALVAASKPGITTEVLDRMASELIEARGGKPSFLNYNKFPATLCVSINEEIVHGLPSTRVLKDGDVLKLDLGVFYNGFHTDSARTVIIGEASSKIRKMVSVASMALDIGIEAAQPGNTTGDVGHAIHEYVKSQGFDVVRDLIGHGVGRGIHEAPEVPNYGKPGEGDVLQPGLVIAIEPMVVMGSYDITEGSDGFAYVTADGKPAAHIEHTVAITANGPDILTK